MNQIYPLNVMHKCVGVRMAVHHILIYACILMCIYIYVRS